MSVHTAKKLSQRARKEAVEQAIREHGWSHELALDLAAKTGWCWRTIYRDRVEILVTLAQEEQEDLPRRRAAVLADLRSLRSGAKEAKQYGPATRTMAMEIQILGLDRVPLPTVEEDDGPVDTSLEGVLAEVRKLRKRAMAGDSYVAAEKLLDREHALVESIRARDQAEAERNRSTLDDDAVVAAVVERLSELPDATRARIKAALGSP